MKSKYALILSLLITILIACNIYIFSIIGKPQLKEIIVARVIDGDTLVTSDQKKIRLLNINTPEKNSKGYRQATEYLKQFENKSIFIEETKPDKYGRTLARLFYDSDYINLKIVSLGLAKKAWVADNEIKKFSKAEAEAIENSKGIWKKSKYYNCFKTTIFPNKEIVKIKNTCQKINMQNWTITDESSKEYKFPSIQIGEITLHTVNGKDNQTDIFWNLKTNIWNNDRDTLYLFDSKNNIAYYNSYNY